MTNNNGFTQKEMLQMVLEKLEEVDNKLEQLKVWFEQEKIDEKEYKQLRKNILGLN